MNTEEMNTQAAHIEEYGERQPYSGLSFMVSVAV